jgi:DNA-binding NarL/FixJ family response regulator
MCLRSRMEPVLDSTRGGCGVDTVMILGSDRKVWEALEEVIELRFPRVRTTRVSTGETMLAGIAAVRPLLVVIDIDLPTESGLEIIRAVRQVHPEVPIISVGRFESPEYEESARVHGADCYLSKESPAEAYEAVLNSVLSKRWNEGRGQEEKTIPGKRAGKRPPRRRPERL